MNMFHGFSYRLLRTFACTTGVCGVLFLYMALQAIRGNLMFLMISIVMFLATVVFTYASWHAHRQRPLSLKGNSVIYSRICPVCKEMLEEHVSICPHCGQPLDSES